MSEYVRMGTLSDFPLLQRIEIALFSNPPATNIVIKGKTHHFHRLVRGTIGGLNYRGYLYLQQNPRSGSSYARRACPPTNHRIIWVIRLREGGDEYVGRIDEGIVWGKPGCFKTKTAKKGA